MPRSPWSVSSWGSVVFVVFLVFAGALPVASAHAESQVEIAIVVLPPVPEPAPIADWAFTMSAILISSGEDVETTTSLDLQVVDALGSDEGWIVKVMQPIRDANDAAPGDDSYLVGSRPQEGRLAGPGEQARAEWLSIGQPLDRMTPVFRAEPGTSAGIHQLRFDVAGHSVSAAPLILSLSTAP